MQKEFNKENETLESRVAIAILQKRSTVTLGGKQYKVANPTLATLIDASRYIAELPKFQIKGGNDDEDEEGKKSNPLFTSIAIASDCSSIAKVIAAMLLGGKKHKGLIYRIRFRRIVRIITDKATQIEINLALRALLDGLQVEYFFVTTTSLIEINLLKARREVDEKTNQTTVSGQ